MKDNLFERLHDLSIGTGSRTPLAAIERIEELEAKLTRAEEMLEREIRRVQKIQRDLPPPHKVDLAYVEAEYGLMLAELKGVNQ